MKTKKKEINENESQKRKYFTRNECTKGNNRKIIFKINRKR